MKARFLITEECNRRCRNCCNTYTKIMQHAKRIKFISNVDWMKFDEIMITGGEPMLNYEKTLAIAGMLKGIAPKLYLYTAFYPGKEPFSRVIDVFDGVHYTLHSPLCKDDYDGFLAAQHQIHKEASSDFSSRLYVDGSIEADVLVRVDAWNRVEVKPWCTEEELLRQQPQGIPEGEVMLILDPTL